MKKFRKILSALLVVAVTFFNTGYVAKAGKPSKPPVTPSSVENLQVHFLKVGQADCTLVRYKNENYLIDGATNEAATTIMNYLTAQGITHLDKIFVSHPHNDHEGALDTIVLSSFVNSSTVVYTNGIETSFDQTAHNEFIAALNKKKIAPKTLVKGTHVATDYDSANLSSNKLDFEVLAPLRQYNGIGTITGDNNNSLFIKMTYGDASFLFAGDVEIEAESELAEAAGQATIPLKSDVLKVPHHGGPSSAVQSFINQVAPQYAVISANNTTGSLPWSFPFSSTVSMLKATGATVLITGQVGNIVFTCDGTEPVKK
jgi:competence protein ComEC